ncbi:hypothetical protein GG344DRAFT_76921 [Lentinula edodes]|nr:hypothetical protein GG344DRAFT_76921 [Lentinula edodes]
MSLSLPARSELSWAEKGELLPPTVPLTRRTKIPSIAPAILPSNKDKLTWVEKGKLLPPVTLLGSHHTEHGGNTAGNMPQYGGRGWVQAGLSLPPLNPVHNTQKLLLNANQQQYIAELYMESKNIESVYNLNDLQQQQEAEVKLIALGLDPVSRNALEIEDIPCAVRVDIMSKPAKNRRVPYPFTGCLAHIEVTERIGDKAISRIAGISEHNSSCETAVLERVPSIPLHEHVYEVALEQLQNGASLTAIQETNGKMVKD